jgi:hypothetical protein
VKEFNVIDKKLKKVMRKAGDRPGMAIRIEIKATKLELREIEKFIDKLKAVKESKVPYWEKLRDHCKETPFYKLTLGKMIHGSV